MMLAFLSFCDVCGLGPSWRDTWEETLGPLVERHHQPLGGEAAGCVSPVPHAGGTLKTTSEP